MYKCFPASSLALISDFFFNVLIEINVNISNELNFSDVYQSVNYTGLPFTLHETQCSLHFNKLQKIKFIS